MFMMRGPNIYLNVYVVDPDAPEVTEEPDCGEGCIILEYNDGDSYDIALGDLVTYQFRSLDYEDCTTTEI